MPSCNFTVFNDYGRHDYVGTDMSVEQGLLTIADDGVSVVHFAPGTWRHVERSFQKEDSPYEALKQQAKDMTDEERRAFIERNKRIQDKFIKQAKGNLDKLYDRREAAYEKAPPAQIGQWQPIETAPKDGTEILLYPYTVAYWDDERSDFYQDESHVFAERPTQWMPLPERPENTP